jgi:predicted metal-binding membrane protein
VTERSLAGALFIAAGLYQFTPLKHACLTKCRAPMPYFLSHWTERASGVFRMGVEQGLACLGCCWAVMLLAFIAGTMNLAWMTLVGVLMILEKTLPAPRPLVSGLGAGLAGAGIAMLVGA